MKGWKKTLMLPWAGGGFTPAALPNVVFGVDAYSLSASPVSSWADLSGNGRHATQGTGSKQPTWGATAFNTSYPGVTFDGTDDFLRTVGFTLDQPFHVVLVCNLATTAVNDVLYDGVAAQAAIYQGVAGGNAYLYAGSNGPLKAISTVPHVLSGVFDNASSTLALDNGAAATGTTGTANPGGVTLGADLAGSAAANVVIAACWVFSAALSVANETALVRYLGSRYGITVA